MSDFKIKYKDITKKNKRKNELENGIATSRINLYALILFVKDFCEFPHDRETFEKMTFEVDKNTYDVIKDDEKAISISEKCCEEPQKYVVNERYIRDGIDGYNPKTHSKNIKNNLQVIFECFALLYIIDKTKNTQSKNNRSRKTLQKNQSF